MPHEQPTTYMRKNSAAESGIIDTQRTAPMKSDITGIMGSSVRLVRRLRSRWFAFPLLAISALVALQIGGGSAPAKTQRPLTTGAVKAVSPFSNLPLTFEPNLGQTGVEVRYLAHHQGATIYFTDAEVVLKLPLRSKGAADNNSRISRPEPVSFHSASPASAVVRLAFVGANSAPAIGHGKELSGKVNYFVGNDPTSWRSNIPRYASITYHELYPGIDVSYADTERHLEGTYVVAPGADPGRICWQYQGPEKVRMDRAGNLQINVMCAGHDQPTTLIEKAPKAWQEVAGRRMPVEVRYKVRDDGSIGFALGSYDPAYPLIIDPTLIYSSYLGGTADDAGYKIAVDKAGNIYVAGLTTSTDFPTANPLQPSKASGYDGFRTPI